MLIVPIAIILTIHFWRQASGKHSRLQDQQLLADQGFLELMLWNLKSTYELCVFHSQSIENIEKLMAETAKVKRSHNSLDRLILVNRIVSDLYSNASRLVEKDLQTCNESHANVQELKNIQEQLAMKAELIQFELERQIHKLETDKYDVYPETPTSNVYESVMFHFANSRSDLSRQFNVLNNLYSKEISKARKSVGKNNITILDKLLRNFTSRPSLKLGSIGRLNSSFVDLDDNSQKILKRHYSLLMQEKIHKTFAVVDEIQNKTFQQALASDQRLIDQYNQSLIDTTDDINRLQLQMDFLQGNTDEYLLLINALSALGCKDHDTLIYTRLLDEASSKINNLTAECGKLELAKDRIVKVIGKASKKLQLAKSKGKFDRLQQHVEKLTRNQRKVIQCL